MLLFSARHYLLVRPLTRRGRTAAKNSLELVIDCHWLVLKYALILLRSSFSAPKVLHLLRCSPSADHQALSNFDAILRRAIQQITNSNVSELQWIQASLPVRDGGLGIRRVSSLALPAFVASAASTLSLQSDILSGCVSSDNNFLQSCLLSWSAQFGDIPEILPPKQPFWDRSGVLADKTVVESSLRYSHLIAVPL